MDPDWWKAAYQQDSLKYQVRRIARARSQTLDRTDSVAPLRTGGTAQAPRGFGHFWVSSLLRSIRTPVCKTSSRKGLLLFVHWCGSFWSLLVLVTLGEQKAREAEHEQLEVEFQQRQQVTGQSRPSDRTTGRSRPSDRTVEPIPSLR
eukprot:4831600-Pyramimonas_sp.AAC.1